MDWDTDGKFFLHRNGQLFINTKTTNQYSKSQSAKYQEILTYVTAIIQTKFTPTTIEKEINYMLKTNPAFIDNNSNLNCYPY